MFSLAALGTHSTNRFLVVQVFDIPSSACKRISVAHGLRPRFSWVPVGHVQFWPGVSRFLPSRMDLLIKNVKKKKSNKQKKYKI